MAVLLAVATGDLPGDVWSALLYPLAGVGAVWSVFFFSRLVVAPAAAFRKVARERDAALTRIEELQAPPHDPDPRIALANQAEHRAARLRAVCVEGEGGMSSTRVLRQGGFSDPHGDREQSEALARYERGDSVETRRLFEQLVAAGGMDPEHRGLIEDPRFLDDLRTAAGHFQEAAERLRREGAREELDDQQLAERSTTLGDAIQQFVIGREAGKKPIDVEPDPDTGLPPLGSEAWQRTQHLHHDLQTKLAYEARYVGQVFGLVRELRNRGYVESDEIGRLNYPESVADIDWVGTRLEQLGRRLGGSS